MIAMEGVAGNYTTILNIIALAAFAALYWLYHNGCASAAAMATPWTQSAACRSRPPPPRPPQSTMASATTSAPTTAKPASLPPAAATTAASPRRPHR